MKIDCHTGHRKHSGKEMTPVDIQNLDSYRPVTDLHWSQKIHLPTFSVPSVANLA